MKSLAMIFEALAARRSFLARGAPCPVALLLFLLLAAGSTALAEDKGGFVKSGQTLRDLGGSDAVTSSAEGTVFPEEWSSGRFRLLGFTMLTLTLFGVLLLVWRRRRLRLGAAGGGTRLEIVEKIALSTRHWVCVLRVDEKRIVVGVSGDRMTTLALLGDVSSVGFPSGGRTGKPEESVGRELEAEGYRLVDAGGGGDDDEVDRTSGASRESRRKSEGAFWFRPENDPERKRDESPWENHLAPYRREVNRLRSMLQNWRQTAEREERPKNDPREAQGE